LAEPRAEQGLAFSLRSKPSLLALPLAIKKDAMDWKTVYKEIEDKLFPYYQFDIWERGLYYYLLGRSKIRGLDSATISLSQISNALSCSDFQSRKTIRSLAEKGCIELEQTRKGHFVKVFLPDELPLPEQTSTEIQIHIETIDFYKNREYLSAILVTAQKVRVVISITLSPIGTA